MSIERTTASQTPTPATTNYIWLSAYWCAAYWSVITVIHWKWCVQCPMSSSILFSSSSSYCLFQFLIQPFHSLFSLRLRRVNECNGKPTPFIETNPENNSAYNLLRNIYIYKYNMCVCDTQKSAISIYRIAMVWF